MTPPHYDRVNDLCRQIHERNAFKSSFAVALGPEAVPALLRRLEDCHAAERHYDEMAIWEPLNALRVITGADPVPDEHAGRLPLIIENWLAWGRKEGHQWRG